MAKRNIASHYRPSRFEEVLGQEHAVAFLSRVVIEGKDLVNDTLGVSVLLHGDFGSGKTTLAKIYCKALNCLSPMDDGSPCDVCRGCNPENIRDQHHELEWLSKPNVAAWLHTHNTAAATNVKCRTLFIDEAHLLSPDEMARMLQAVETPQERVVFCFATTDPERLSAPLRSRLVDLAIKPLPTRASVALLKRVAKDEKISYEVDALELLASLKAGHPRDLIHGLEQLAKGGHRVTVERVRFVFDVDHADILTRYFGALADGDLAQQTEIIFGWRERPADKARWIVAFLTSLYYNDILRRELILDGVVAFIKDGRSATIERFCRGSGWRTRLSSLPTGAI